MMKKKEVASMTSGTRMKRHAPTTFSRQYPRVDLIFNEVSGKSDPATDLDTITAALEPSFSTLRVWRTTAQLDGYVLALHAVASGATLLVACGGDGTVAAVAAAVKMCRRQRILDGTADSRTRTDDEYDEDVSNGDHAIASSSSVDGITGTDVDVDILLGVIPRGTANALCAALHIPTDVFAAARMIASGSVRSLDCPTIVDSSPVSTPVLPLFPTVSTEFASPQTIATSALATSAQQPTTQPTSTMTTATATPHASSASCPQSMLLLAGIGLEAETVLRAHRRLKRALGAAAYALVGLSTIWRKRHFRTDVTLYDVADTLMFARGTVTAPVLRLRDLRLQGVTIANAAPPTSVLAQGIGDVCPDDGLLEVVCITYRHPLAMIRTMVSMLCSALLRRRQVRGAVYGLRARKVTIECDPPQPVVVDGEDAGFTPITIQLGGHGDCIDVIAPKAGTVNRQKRKISRSLTRLWRNIRGFTMFALAMSLLNQSRR